MNHLHTITCRPPLALTNFGIWMTAKVADDGGEFQSIMTHKNSDKSERA